MNLDSLLSALQSDEGRRAVAAFIVFLFVTTMAHAQEARCTELGANCVCSETFESTSYSALGSGGDQWAWVGDAMGSKPCETTDGASSIRAYFGNSTSGVFSSSLATGCPSGVSCGQNSVNASTAFAALPSGHSVARFLRAGGDNFGTGVASTYAAGDPSVSLGSAKRVSIRWYQYYSSDYENADKVFCNNNKFSIISPSGGDSFPEIVFEWYPSGTNEPTHEYGWINGNGWSWSGASTWDGFASNAKAPRPLGGTSTPVLSDSIQGKWIRFEIIIRRPRTADSNTAGLGLDFELWITNVTDSAAPVLDMRFSGPASGHVACTACMIINGSVLQDFTWDTSIYPDSDITNISMLNYRCPGDSGGCGAGHCYGWQGWSHMVVAKWDSDDCTGITCNSGLNGMPTAGQSGPMIGAATEVEGGAGQTCGNDTIEGTEVCDGTDLASETCASQGLSSGTLACNGGCTAFDTSACVGAIRGVAIRGGTVK